MEEKIQDKLKRHYAFWQGAETDRPLVGFQVGSYFMAQRYEAAQELLVHGKRITPDLLDPQAFLADYERHYQYTQEINQDAFFVAEPYTGIPWMEAMLGCPIYASTESMWAEPWMKDWSEVSNLSLNEDNPWFRKFVEFVEVTVAYAKGRFPVGQPILRGPTDMVGAIIGQSNFPYEVMDNPDKIRDLAGRTAQAFLQVVDALQKKAAPFEGGYSMGFYHLWTPGHCIWYQEDLSALLSPTLFRELFLTYHYDFCRYAPFNAVHLHPASFFLLDEMLKVDDLKIVEINKDVGGPSIEAMLPQFRKVIAAERKLIIWGALDEKDLQVIMEELPKKNVYLNIVVETPALGAHLMDNLKGLAQKKVRSIIGAQ